MPGLDPGIHALCFRGKNVDGRDEPGHDGASGAIDRTRHALWMSPASRSHADLSGALFWEEQRLLVVSDLHLEKGSSFATRGVLLPPYDTWQR